MNSGGAKTAVPRVTKAEQDAFINKYLPKLMGTENTPKINYGPNREMAGTVKLNTSKPAVTVPKTAVSTTKPTGPNVEMTKAVKLEGKPQNLRYAIENLKNSKGPSYEISQTRLEGNPQAFYSAVANMQENKGISRETARTNYLDPRGQNITDKIINDISNEINMVRYGADYLKDENHTNTVVTKDNVYSLPPQTVSAELRKAKENVTALKNDKKQQRDELLFRMHMLQAQGYGDSYSDELKKQVDALDADIRNLNIKNLKANIGYEMTQNYIKILSETQGDDILKIIEDYNNYGYMSSDTSVSRVFGKVEDVVSILDNTKVERTHQKSFKIYNANDRKNSFTISPNFSTDEYGFTEYSLSVKADNIDNLTPEQKNLYSVLDDMPISKKMYNFLKNPPDILKKLDMAKAGEGLMVAGYAIDALDFVVMAVADAEDGDISKTTTQKITGMIFKWLGGIAGAELGAMTGIAIGTVIMPGVGTTILGAVGAVVGAKILSDLAEDLGVYLGGLDYGAEQDIEQYIVRGR